MRLPASLVTTGLATVGLVTCLISQPLFAQSTPKTILSPTAVKAPAIQPTKADPNLTQLRLRTLPKDKRLQLWNQARAQAKLPAVATPPASTTRISAAAPASPAGALIQQAKASLYAGPSTSDPDGYFSLGEAGPNGAGDYVALSFPVEKDKLYVLDCTVRSEGDQPVRFSNALGGTVTDTATPVDDHVMVVVRATSSRISRVLQSNAAHWWWSACDIAPAG